MSELQLTTKTLFARQDVRAKFEEMLGSRAPQFITSVLQIANSNAMLQNADPMSIYNAAATAATLNLPINQNLGFAYILPYNQKQSDGSYKSVAQFQLGYKGFIQLAQRSGQFQTIAASPIFEGQLVEQNPLTGFVFDFSKKESEKVIGYAAYFRLINGFEKTLYMKIEEVDKHAKKYSQTFKKGYGLWKDEFDSMAQKTVIKLLLSKFAPLSVEMEKAVIMDQSVIKNTETMEVEYVDNKPGQLESPKLSDEEIKEQRVLELINTSTSIKDLQSVVKGQKLSEKANDLFNQKMHELDGKAN
jgi:recombination protein RecT